VKKVARLVLFFSLSFAVLFILAALVRYLVIRIGVLRLLPAREETYLSELITAARWALPFAVYFSLLFGLSYAARLKMFIPLSIFCLVILAGGLGTALSMGLERAGFVPPARDTVRPLGGPGLILARGDTAIVLPGGPAEPKGPRVVSFPGRPLIYQENPQGPNDTTPALPPVPFRTGVPWFLESLSIDFTLSGGQLEARFREGFIPFLTYALSLIFLLASFRFVMDLSVWPLANLFTGALIFRGILALETFINSPETGELLAPFLGNRIAPENMGPLVFCSFAVLICLYTALVSVAKRRFDED
jgi:hypothetical protein